MEKYMLAADLKMFMFMILQILVGQEQQGFQMLYIH